MGLSWVFLRAGAPNVIGALWEVSDGSTPQLMDAFYRELFRGKDPPWPCATPSSGSCVPPTLTPSLRSPSTGPPSSCTPARSRCAGNSGTGWDCSRAVEAVILGETISHTRSPLVRELLSPESHASMNLSDKTTKLSENNLASRRDLPEEIDSRMRVEPCEFESLLQRAVEILSARAQSATASSF